MRFRLAALALVAVLASSALTGCDSSGPTNALRDLDGTYSVAELVFDPAAGLLDDADVGARLDPTATAFDVFAGSESARFVVSRDRIRSELTFRATATRGRVTFTAATGSEGALRALLLPGTFTLTYDPASPRTLTGDIPLPSVDLEAFDPVGYAGQRAVSGTLRIRLDRRASN